MRTLDVNFYTKNDLKHWGFSENEAVFPSVSQLTVDMCHDITCAPANVEEMEVFVNKCLFFKMHDVIWTAFLII